MTTRRVLLACDLDSQIFGALPLALAFAARGWKTTFAIESIDAVPAQLFERLTRDFEIVERSLGALPTDDATFDCDAVGVFATGSRLALFRHMLELSSRAKARPRPALFGGFNGLVFEKFEEGLAWRLGYDLIGLNGPRDRDAFTDFLQGTAFEGQPSVIVGLRRKTDAPPKPLKLASTAAAGSSKIFVFAEQVIVPRGPYDRRALIASLARLAAASPGWTVLVKARVRPEERTFHGQQVHVSALVDEIDPRPANFSVSYEPLDELLPSADLFATVSSTALFDAFDHGVPSLVVSDFGVRNGDGAHVFFASGLLIELDGLRSLDDAPLRAPDARWLARMGYGDPYSPDALIDWLEAFDPSRPMPEAVVSAQTAVRRACGHEARAAEICDLWSRIEASLSTGAGDRAAAERRASLARLGTLASEALQAGSAGPQNEGPIARFARSVKMYWFYKRVRARLGIPVG